MQIVIYERRGFIWDSVIGFSAIRASDDTKLRILHSLRFDTWE
jgi:hypothetical protein